MLRFGDCVLDPARFVLVRGGTEEPVEPQVFAVLEYLVRNRGRVVTKDELLDAVWGTRFVSEAALTSRVRAVRAAIGDSGERQTLIRTVRGHGYEFVGEVADSGDVPASTLPAPVLRLIGRDALVADVADELASARLVTLVGPGGVGKTSIAYEVARSIERTFADGVHAAELVTADAPTTLAALATALGVQKRREADLAGAVLDVLRPQQALLVLDNCEHVVEPLARLVERILQTAPRVVVLATSRRPLAIRGERIWPVAPLERTEAVELFAERARAVDPGFVVDATCREVVARICDRLDGMPLAIELAAARTATLSVAELERHLDERFRLLRSVRRGGDPRHAALQDAVEWSFDLLHADDQRRFGQLATFAGPFDSAAAAAICGESDEIAALDAIARLVDCSMLTVRRDGAAGARYEMLETLREYGRASLAPRLRVDAEDRHLRFHVRFAAEVERAQRTEAEPAATARAATAFADLRAALHAATRRRNVAAALTLVTSIREYGMRSLRYEAFTWADEALALPGAEQHPAYACTLGVQAYAAWIRGEFASALALADRVAAIEATSGDPCGLAERTRLNVLGVQGDVAGAISAGRRQLELAEASGDPSREVHAAYMLSIALNSGDDPDAPVALATHARRVAESTGSPTDLASAWAATGFAARGDPAAGIAAFTECDRLARLAGNRWMSTFARTEVSALRLLVDDVAAGAAGLAACVEAWLRAGEWSQQLVTLGRCVVALNALGAYELAAEALGAVERRAAMGTPPVGAALRPSTLRAGDELAARLGDGFKPAYERGAAAPIDETVHRVRRELAAQVDR